MMKRLLVIPARGGSQRIKKKNIKFFCGRPIIEYSINAAKDSSLFDEIHVSTEDDEVYKVCSALNVQPKFLRPKYQSHNDYPLISLIRDVKNEFLNLNKSFDEIWMLLPCAPLITHEDLIDASKNFLDMKCLGMISVCEYPAPTEWAFKIDQNKKLTPLSADLMLKPSQEISESYFDTGAFCIFSNDLLASTTLNIYSQLHAYVLPKHKSVDIDTIDDWNFAEKIFLANK